MANTCAGANTAASPRRSLSMFVAVVLVMGLVTGVVHAETSSVERVESIVLHAGEWLSV